MHELTRDQASQFIVATHSRFMVYPEAAIYLLSDSGIRSVAYEETEHYQLVRGFGHRDKLMKELLSEDAITTVRASKSGGPGDPLTASRHTAGSLALPLPAWDSA